MSKLCASTRFCARADRAGHQRMLDDLALLDAHALHQARDALAAEQAHQVVLERQEEARRARIALAAGAAAQLPVDAPRLVALGAEDVQAAQVRRRPAPSLMSVPRPAMLVAMVTAPRWPAVGDDLGFLLVVLGVQHVVLDAAPLEHARQQLADLDADRADQHRLARARGSSAISSITALYFSRLVR